jgi:hypothetical protein
VPGPLADHEVLERVNIGPGSRDDAMVAAGGQSARGRLKWFTQEPGQGQDKSMRSM